MYAVDSFLFQYSVSYLLGGMFFAFLSTYIFLRAPKEALNRVFSFYCFCIAWWSIFSIPMINASSEAWGIFWDRICLVGVILIPPTFVYFNFIFLGHARRYSRFIAANYIVSAFFLAINFTPLFVAHNSPKFGLNYYTDPGPLYLPFVIYFFMTSIFTIFILYSGTKNSRPIQKKQAVLLFWASLLGYSLGGLNYNPSFGLGPEYLPLVGNLGVVAYALIVAYIITKHRLMDISVVISRAVAEVLSILFHGTVYLGLVWLYRLNISTRIDGPFLAGTILYGILVGQTHQRMRLFIQTSSDKLFIRGKYDYYLELSEISFQLSRSLSLKNILETLQRTFYEIIEVSDPRVYLKDDFEKDEVKGLLGIKKPTFLAQDLILPCLIGERTIALIVLGPKHSEDPYTDGDLRLLKNLANQTAVALDHCLLYEETLKTQKRLLASDKLSSLGRVAAGLAHEIKNPLAAVKGMIQSIDRNIDDPEFLKDLKEVVPREINRLKNLVENLLRLDQASPLQSRPVNINNLIGNALKLFEKRCRENKIEVIVEPGSLPEIKADPEQLTQVFTNLILNAIQAMARGGKLGIATRSAGDKIIIEILDTGEGIPEDKIKEIFEPFFSTKKEGMGLGLATTYKIIKDHGGKIEADSEVGKGTNLRVFLPC